MKKNGRVDKLLRVVMVFLAACSLHISTVNHWNDKKPDNWWNFSPENFRRFYEQNSGWEMVMHHFLMLDYAVLLVAPLVIIAWTLRYLITGKLRKDSSTAKCCEHCQAKAEAVSEQA